MSLAVVIPYQSFISLPTPPPTPVLGITSIKPEVNIELLKELLLFGDMSLSQAR